MVIARACRRWKPCPACGVQSSRVHSYRAGDLSVNGQRLEVRVRMRPSAAAASPAPCALGDGDWAFRKGRTYGALLVDLERHAVVDLLPDRTSSTLFGVAGCSSWRGGHRA